MSAPESVPLANDHQPQAEVQDLQPETPAFRIFKPPKSVGGEPIQDLPDSYFTPSAADLRAAQASLTARAQSLVDAPLRTQSMREAEDKVKRSKYPMTTIRVRFSDRTQLQKTFPSTDKIRAVYAFVRNSLRDDAKSIKFVLYQTPPKRELKVSDPKVRDLTLYDLQLAPSSILHLKFLDESLNHVNVPAPLDQSILVHAEDLPIPPDVAQSTPSNEPSSSSSTPARSVGNTLGRTTESVEKKMAKWLKLGPKK